MATVILSVDEIIDLSRKGPLDHVGRLLAAAAEARMKQPAPGEPSKPDDLACILFRLARPVDSASGSRAGVN